MKQERTAEDMGPPPLAEAVARLRHEMARGVDYAVVDIADLRAVLEALGEQFDPGPTSAPPEEV